MQRGEAAKLGLEPARVGAIEFFQRFLSPKAVGIRAGAEPRQDRQFRFFAGYDQLADPPAIDAAFGTIGVKQAPAGDAEPRLQAAGRVVDAGVDHLAAAGRYAAADAVGGFENHHLKSAQRQNAGTGQAHRPRAHHQRIDAFGQFRPP